MLKDLKTMLFSENGMKIVNVLFWITAFFRSRTLTILTYTAWVVFLACTVRHTESRGMKAFYLILIVFAAAVVVWQLVWLVTGLFDWFS